MARIILDFGSGNSCKNSEPYVKRMVDELKAVDTGKHEVIIKWQLFFEAGENIPLKQPVFSFAYTYAERKGYKTTASVFDKPSLDFLLKYDPCFIKIANNRKLDYLIGEVPRKVPIYVSYDSVFPDAYSESHFDVIPMICVSKYPATLSEYQKHEGALFHAVSDHTTNFDLWNKYQPDIIEWHYKLEDSTGLDAGPFARTPEQLAEVL